VDIVLEGCREIGTGTDESRGERGWWKKGWSVGGKRQGRYYRVLSRACGRGGRWGRDGKAGRRVRGGGRAGVGGRAVGTAWWLRIGREN